VAWLLAEAVNNLVDNAINYTPAGGSVTVRCGTNGREAFLEVVDTGVGIPASDLELIFEKFRRSGDVLTNNIQGTGLGLAITRQIVEYHDGAVWAESIPGQGSVFSFTLPLTKEWNIEGEQQPMTASL